MNLYYYSKHMLTIFNNNNELINYFKELSLCQETLIINPKDIANLPAGGTELSESVNEIRNEINDDLKKTLSIIRKNKPLNVMSLISNFIVELMASDDTFGSDNNFIEKLSEFIKLHTDAYSDETLPHVYKLTKLSSKLYQSISSYIEHFEFIVESNEKNFDSIPSTHNIISINSDQKTYYISEFVNIFTSIEKLYEYICFIYQIDAEKPNNKLLINDIHTGSWATDLLGIKQVVITIENLLKGIGVFLRDLITGQISKEMYLNKCEQMSAYMDLVKKAKEIGIDNPEVGLLKCLKPFGEIAEKGMTTLEVNGEDVLNLSAYEKLIIKIIKLDLEKLIESATQIEQLEEKE